MLPEPPVIVVHLTEWGEGFVVGACVSAVATALLVFAVIVLVLDMLTARYPVVVLDRRAEAEEARARREREEEAKRVH